MEKELDFARQNGYNPPAYLFEQGERSMGINAATMTSPLKSFFINMSQSSAQQRAVFVIFDGTGGSEGREGGELVEGVLSGI